MSLQPQPLHPTERLLTRLTLVVVTGWLVFCAIQPHMPVNPASRLAAIQALVEQQTWAIDGVSLGSMTIDKVFLNGHFYSSKPPVLNLFGALLYAIIKPLSGWTFDSHLFQLGSLFGILLGTLPWLLGVLLFQRLLRLTVSSWQVRTVSVLAITLSSLATAYGATARPSCSHPAESKVPGASNKRWFTSVSAPRTCAGATSSGSFPCKTTCPSA